MHGSMSISSGMAPAISIAATVATAVCETVTTVAAGPDAQRAQRQRQRIGAVGAPDRMRRAQPRRELRLERAPLGAEDVPARVQRARHRRVDLAPAMRDSRRRDWPAER